MIRNNNKIIAILSDYDGTLCPTTYTNSKGDLGYIPVKLEEVLHFISNIIPICIISSKDFYFLYERTRNFASAISCLLGMETLFLTEKRPNKLLHTIPNNTLEDFYLKNMFSSLSVRSRHLLIDSEVICENSIILEELVYYFEVNHPQINISKKYLTIGKEILGGITIDWRNDEKKDWDKNNKKYKKIMKDAFHNIFDKNMRRADKIDTLKDKDFEYFLQRFFVQQYATHPFIDIYASKIGKDVAYDCVLSEIINLNHDLGKVIYLGDSENDNPAFKRADISIGIHSEPEMRPNLFCSYHLNYEELPLFLGKLYKNNLEFSESLLNL